MVRKKPRRIVKKTKHPTPQQRSAREAAKKREVFYRKVGAALIRNGITNNKKGVAILAGVIKLKKAIVQKDVSEQRRLVAAIRRQLGEKTVSFLQEVEIIVV